MVPAKNAVTIKLGHNKHAGDRAFLFVIVVVYTRDNSSTQYRHKTLFLRYNQEFVITENSFIQ